MSSSMGKSLTSVSGFHCRVTSRSPGKICHFVPSSNSTIWLSECAVIFIGCPAWIAHSKQVVRTGFGSALCDQLPSANFSAAVPRTRSAPAQVSHTGGRGCHLSASGELRGLAGVFVVFPAAPVIGVAPGARVTHLEKFSRHVGANKVILIEIGFEHLMNLRCASFSNSRSFETPMRVELAFVQPANQRRLVPLSLQGRASDACDNRRPASRRRKLCRTRGKTAVI